MSHACTILLWTNVGHHASPPTLEKVMKYMREATHWSDVKMNFFLLFLPFCTLQPQYPESWQETMRESRLNYTGSLVKPATPTATCPGISVPVKRYEHSWNVMRTRSYFKGLPRGIFCVTTNCPNMLVFPYWVYTYKKGSLRSRSTEH